LNVLQQNTYVQKHITHYILAVILDQELIP